MLLWLVLLSNHFILGFDWWVIPVVVVWNVANHFICGLTEEWLVLLWLAMLPTVIAWGLTEEWFVLLMVAMLPTIIIWSLTEQWFVLLKLVKLLPISVWCFTEELFVLLWLVILLHINVYLYFPIIIPKQFLSPTPICFEQIVFISDITLNYLAFPSFDFEPSWWRVFQRRLVCTKLDIYVVITRCTSLILWNWIDITMTA